MSTNCCHLVKAQSDWIHAIVFSWKSPKQWLFVLISNTLFIMPFLSASPLPHQFNGGVLSTAFPQVVSSGKNPTPLSPVQLQQEGEDIFIGLQGDISMAAIVSTSSHLVLNYYSIVNWQGRGKVPCWDLVSPSTLPTHNFRPTSNTHTKKPNLFSFLPTMKDWICGECCSPEKGGLMNETPLIIYSSSQSH